MPPEKCTHGLVLQSCIYCRPGGRKSQKTSTALPSIPDFDPGDERLLIGDQPDDDAEEQDESLEPAEAPFDPRYESKKDPRKQLGWDIRLTDDSSSPVASTVARKRTLDSTPLEIAQALQLLRSKGWTIQKIAESYEVSQAWVRQHLDLTKLSPEVQALMDPARPRSQLLATTVAAALVSFPPEVQYELAKGILDDDLRVNRALGRIRVRKHSSPVG